MPGGVQQPGNRLPRFSEAEDDLLRQFYNKIPVEELVQKLPGRSAASVRGRANKLQLTSKGNQGNGPSVRRKREQAQKLLTGLTPAERFVIREGLSEKQQKEVERQVMQALTGIAAFDPMLRRVAKEKALGLSPKSLIKFNNDGNVANHYD